MTFFIFRDEDLTNILLYGNQIYHDKTNQITLMHVIRYIKDSKKFDKLLFNPPETIADFLHFYHFFFFLTNIRCKAFLYQVLNFC